MAETDDKKDDKKDDKGGGGGGGSTTKDEIREVVSEVLGGLFKSGRADVHDDDDDDDDRGRSRRRSGGGRARGGLDVGDIGAQVEAAVERVTAKSAATAKEAEREARLKALEEKTAKPERTPREFRKVTKLMWGDPDGD